MEYKWRVKKSERGMSLENFIYKQLGEWSHNQVKRAIDDKRAFVNGKNVFVSKWNVKPNDTVLFVPVMRDTPQAPQGRYKFVDVLFEDNYIIVTNKTPFIDFEDYTQTVVEYLKRKNKIKSYPYLGQMHRLDKETSGVMVFTKKKVANSLADQFRDHTIQKHYVALVDGCFPKEQATIRKPIEKGEFDEGRKVRVSKTGKRAITNVRVKERYDNVSFLHIEILTGRTHQIRIHLSDAGYPVVGDKIYGQEKGYEARRQMLHAECLMFKHPVTKEKMKIVAPLPQDFTGLVDKLRDSV